MYDLTVIKQNGGAYIGSREVAKAIGKQHKNLLRDIAGYIGYMEKITKLNFEPSAFFLESSYFDSTGRELPCYLISKMGCELCANKLIGEKGVLFTATYVQRFNEMEAAERDSEIKAHARPRLSEFNNAARNILSGMSQCCTKPDSVMKFLCGVYEPFGIDVLPFNADYYYGYYSVTEIARCLGVYSETGKPHGHAISAIISKLDCYEYSTIAIPYGLVGVSFRYDNLVVEAVKNWLSENNYPHEVPYQGFDYHIYYDSKTSLFDAADDDFDFSVEIHLKIKK